MHAAAVRVEERLVVGSISPHNAALRALRRGWFRAQGKDETPFPEAMRWLGASLGGRLLAVLGYLDQDVPVAQRWFYEFYRQPGIDADAIDAARALLDEARSEVAGKRKALATLPGEGENAVLERYLRKIGGRCAAQIWEFPD